MARFAGLVTKLKTEESEAMNEKTYVVTNERYSHDPEMATMAEIIDLLRNTFGDEETELEERADGVYEVRSGERVAEAVSCCEHESVTTPDGHGAYCKHCGETLA